MKNTIARLVKFFFKKLGYSISKNEKKGFIDYKDYRSLNVGCGDHILTEYINCDSRYAKGVDLVCNAWEVSRYLPYKMNYILCRHMLEHLTLKEVEAALTDWYEVLDVCGCIEIIVPNLPYHINQFLNATWSIDELNQSHSDASWGLAGLYGWQRDCDTSKLNCNNKYWDVHKIGFNKELLLFLLMRAGYSNIEVDVEENCHLIAKAKKITLKGERQVSPFIQDIRIDHRARYEFIRDYIKDGFKILDAACGIGYGSYIIKNGKKIRVLGLDIDNGAVAYANEYYKIEGIDFLQADILKADLSNSLFDIIICFETLEHVENDKKLLNKFYNLLENDGMLMLSTPNQLNMPFSKLSFPFHVKHYEPQSLVLLLEESGFCIEEVFSQPNGYTDVINQGWNGCFNILICRKL